MPLEQKTMLPMSDTSFRGAGSLHAAQYHFPVMASPSASFFLPPMLCPTKKPLWQLSHTKIEAFEAVHALLCSFAMLRGRCILKYGSASDNTRARKSTTFSSSDAVFHTA